MAAITIRQCYEEGITRLREWPRPELETRLLLREAAGITEIEFFTYPDRKLTKRQYRRFNRLLSLRGKGYPTAYLTGKKEFWSLDFHVDPGVLIPRPETELLIEQVMTVVNDDDPVVVDVGTGSGNIAVALARELSGARIYALDISRRALKTARRNAREHGAVGLIFLEGDLLDPLKNTDLMGKVDVIVSNPPYVSQLEWEVLPPQIRDHEPKQALVPGESGLEMIRRLIGEACFWLKPGGYLIMECGSSQEAAVLQLFGDSWEDIRSLPDLSGLPRVCLARRNAWKPPAW